MPEAAAAEPAARSSLASAADRLREAAKWLVGAFAAVGVVLAGGLQLAAIGELSFDDPLRLCFAVVGLVATVVGIGVAIGAAAGIPSSSYVSLAWLTSNPDDKATQVVAADPALRAYKATIEAFRTEVDRVLPEAEALYAEIFATGPPGETPALRDIRVAEATAAYDPVRQQAEFLVAARDNTLDVASFSRVRFAYEDARTRMLVGALVAAAGLGAFAWGANGPARDPVPAGEVLPKTPSEVTVIIKAASRSDIAKLLGSGCDVASLDGIALAVKGDTYQIATVKTKECSPALLEVSPAIGDVVPRVDPAATTPPSVPEKDSSTQ